MLSNTFLNSINKISQRVKPFQRFIVLCFLRIYFQLKEMSFSVLTMLKRRLLCGEYWFFVQRSSPVHQLSKYYSCFSTASTIYIQYECHTDSVCYLCVKSITLVKSFTGKVNLFFCAYLNERMVQPGVHRVSKRTKVKVRLNVSNICFNVGGV